MNAHYLNFACHYLFNLESYLCRYALSDIPWQLTVERLKEIFLNIFKNGCTFILSQILIYVRRPDKISLMLTFFISR